MLGWSVGTKGWCGTYKRTWYTAKIRKKANDTYLVAACDLITEEIRYGYPAYNAIVGSFVEHVMSDSYPGDCGRTRRPLSIK